MASSFLNLKKVVVFLSIFEKNYNYIYNYNWSEIMGPPAGLS